MRELTLDYFLYHIKKKKMICIDKKHREQTDEISDEQKLWRFYGQLKVQWVTVIGPPIDRIDVDINESSMGESWDESEYYLEVSIIFNFNSYSLVV